MMTPPFGVMLICLRDAPPVANHQTVEAFQDENLAYPLQATQAVCEDSRSAHWLWPDVSPRVDCAIRRRYASKIPSVGAAVAERFSVF